MRDLLRFVRRVAISQASTVLIEGETGTGKDLVAQILHTQSGRQSGPFLTVNCATIPETLLESELFGHEKGAFTDAKSQKRGLFELANRGTVFLDEVDALPRSLQPKLLRVLESRTFRRLGGLSEIEVDIRIIAASNKDLHRAARKGSFRSDLLYRLNMFQIVIPPLRERLEDLLPLARFFVEQYNKSFNRDIAGITNEAVDALFGHDWPGNVRELRNAIEHAIILEETDQIRADSLPLAIRDGRSGHTHTGVDRRVSGERMSLVAQERRLVVEALQKTRGNQTRAALLLQITRDTLRYRMKKFHLIQKDTDRVHLSDENHLQPSNSN
jgi:transcriptional regulator with PAS, ATPase and Fis domain